MEEREKKPLRLKEKHRNRYRNSGSLGLRERKSEPLSEPNRALGRVAVRNDFRQKRTPYCWEPRESLLLPHGFFLKDSWACLSALAWCGRGTFCRKPRWRTRSQVAVLPKEIPNSISIASVSLGKVQKTGSP